MPSVFERLQPHWWSLVDDEGLDIPLTAVDQENALGERPVHIAAWKGEPQDIAWLLDHGANINQPGEFEMTPLHYAYMGDKPDNVAMLLGRGANRFARCDRGLLAHEGRAKEPHRPGLPQTNTHECRPASNAIQPPLRRPPLTKSNRSTVLTCDDCRQLPSSIKP